MPSRKPSSPARYGQATRFPQSASSAKHSKSIPNRPQVVTNLVAEGILEVHSGIGTVVAERAASTAADRANLLNKELEQLVVEAKKLGLNLDVVTVGCPALEASGRSKT